MRGFCLLVQRSKKGFSPKVLSFDNDIRNPNIFDPTKARKHETTVNSWVEGLGFIWGSVCILADIWG